MSSCIPSASPTRAVRVSARACACCMCAHERPPDGVKQPHTDQWGATGAFPRRALSSAISSSPTGAALGTYLHLWSRARCRAHLRRSMPPLHSAAFLPPCSLTHAALIAAGSECGPSPPRAMPLAPHRLLPAPLLHRTGCSQHHPVSFPSGAQRFNQRAPLPLELPTRMDARSLAASLSLTSPLGDPRAFPSCIELRERRAGGIKWGSGAR